MTATVLHRGRLVRRAVVALVLAATAASTVAPLAAVADDTVGIAGGPATADGPDQRSRFSYQTAPGQKVTDHYVVRNTGSTPQDVRVFATDAYNTADGAFALLDTDAKATGPGTWVAFDGGQPQVQVHLDPAEQKVLAFTVTVPADATPGDHAAGIVVSAAATQGQVKVDRRVASRMYLRVAGALQPNLTLGNMSARQDATWNPFTGTTDITVTLHNTGNVALGADVTATVGTWFGMSAGGTAHDKVAELLPGATRSVTFHVKGVGRVGYLKPQVKLQPTIAPDALNPGALKLVVRDTSLVSLPWLLVVVLVVVAAFVVLLRWRRRRAESAVAKWVEYTREQAQREALAQLAREPEAAS